MRLTRDRGQRRTAGVDSTAWWQFQPGQRVMTREGVPGVVDRVEDGPVGGAELYIVTLDAGLGGGEYDSSELAPEGEVPGRSDPRTLPRTLAALETSYEEQGTYGNRTHITFEQTGTLPTSVIANMPGVMDEVPGEHRNKQGEQWEDFKSDIAVNGIQHPIFITVNPGEAPKISEGNHRRDVAVDLGLPEVPVTVRYFGHAERDTKLGYVIAGDNGCSACGGTGEQGNGFECYICDGSGDSKAEAEGRAQGVTNDNPENGLPQGVDLSATASVTLAPASGGNAAQFPGSMVLSMPGGSLQYSEGVQGYGNSGATIHAVFVDPDARRQGIATQLLDALAERFKGQPIDPGGLTADGAPLWQGWVAANGWVEVNDIVWLETEEEFYEDEDLEAQGVLRARAAVEWTEDQWNGNLGAEVSENVYVWVRKGFPSGWTWDVQSFISDRNIADTVAGGFAATKEEAQDDALRAAMSRSASAISDRATSVAGNTPQQEFANGVADRSGLEGRFIDGELHTAADDYPELGSILLERPDHQISVRASKDDPTVGGLYDPETYQWKPHAYVPTAVSHHRTCAVCGRGAAQDVHRQQVQADLVEVPPNDPTAGEAEVRRCIEEGDFTHVGLAIKAVDSGRVLLVQRTPFEGDPEKVFGRWEFPGGGIDEGEDPLEGALREFAEETGLKAPKMRLVGAMPAGTYLLIMALVPSEGWTTDAHLLDFEVMGIGWFHPDQIENADDLVREEMDDTEWDMVREAMRRVAVAGEDTDAKSWKKGDIVIDSVGQRWRVTYPYGSSSAENLYVAQEDDVEPYPESNRAVRVYTDGTAKYTKDDTPFRRTSGIVDKAIDWVADKTDYEPGHNWSYDWCRFRKNSRCFYPRQLDEEATKQAGYAVWVPEDRGFCPRQQWGEQKSCPVAEPGPHSGEHNAMPDATVSWGAGGQRYSKLAKDGFPPKKDEERDDDKSDNLNEPDKPVEVGQGGDPNFEESEHPRDNDGKFAPKTTPPRTKPNAASSDTDPNGDPVEQPLDPALDPAVADGEVSEVGAGGGPLGIGEEPSDDGSPGSKSNPIKTNDIEEAASALGEGKYVELEQPKQVSTLLDELASRIQEAKDSGGELNINLCQVTVPGTNLFCAESQGIARIEMPQLKSSKVTPGSRAEQELSPNENGEYDLQPAFKQMLQDKGIGVENDTELAANLKATQNELNAGKIAGITDAILGGGDVGNESIFVSKDDYILDGHHRWASDIAADYVDGDATDISMNIERVDMSIIELLAEANRFAAEWGIPQQGVTASRKMCCEDCSDMSRFAGLADGGEFGWHLTARWRDVQGKAKRIRSEGGVRIIANSGTTVTAEVRGDTAIYQTSIMRFGKSVATWECGCKWGAYSWGRSGRWTKFEGRMCSHALALTYQAQADEMFGGTIQEQSEKPEWQNDPTQTTRLPGDQKMVTRPWRIGVLQAHGMRPVGTDAELHQAPALAMAVGFLEQAMEPSDVIASLRALGARDAEGFVVQALKGFPFRARVRGVIETILGLLPDGMFDTSAGPVRGIDIIHPTYDRSLGLSLRDTVGAYHHFDQEKKPGPAWDGSRGPESDHEATVDGLKNTHRGPKSECPLCPKEGGVLPADGNCRVCGYRIAIEDVGSSKIVICPKCDAMYAYQPVTFTADKDPRFEGVGLKQDDDGWYVSTHRARSDSYPTPEDIPTADVVFIESTGAKTADTYDTTTWDGYSMGPAIVPNTSDDPEDFSDPLAAPEYVWGQGDGIDTIVLMPDGSLYPYDRPWFDYPAVMGGFYEEFDPVMYENLVAAMDVTGLFIDPSDAKQKAQEGDEPDVAQEVTESTTASLPDSPLWSLLGWPEDGTEATEEASAAGLLTELHEEPEPALPTTDGEIDIDIDAIPVEQLPGHPALAHLMKGSPPKESSTSPQTASDSDIAAMARKVLATKTFTPAEQQQIITEGEGVTASNLDLLDIAGTHYEALEAALVSSDPSDDGALFG